MKIVKKFVCMAVVLNLSFFNLAAVKAETGQVYSCSEQLSELKSLMDECGARGIPTDYENVNYAVLERFEGYINEDIENGVADSITQFNIGEMDRLYSEAKENLEGYLNGTKTPYDINRADMSRIYNENSVLYDRNKPVFSIGYGHFQQARTDVPYFQNFGANNIQTEIGPTKLKKSMDGWNESINGNLNISVSITDKVKNSGEKSLRINNTSPSVSNVYWQMYQFIDCKPDTAYRFGCYSFGNEVNKLWISANGFTGEDRKYISSSTEWSKNEFVYTSKSDQTQLRFNLICEGISTVYIDDFYLYELDGEGNPTGENLIKNYGMESGYTYDKSVKYILDTLEAAESNNIGVSLLLSPHYFPDDLSDEIYTDKGGFIKYNINAPEAKTVIEEYLRALLPYLSEYKSLQNICLSNEPVFNTVNFYDFYNPLFREYVQEIHGTIENLNMAYQTSYADFSEVNMPRELTSHSPVCYDWIEFNDRVFTDWHKWMADIVREYLPEVPLHSKMMGYFTAGAEDNARSMLARGTDIELFDEFSDYAGNDTWDFMERESGYHTSMFLYDYQHSVTNKPVYNSEDHIISDRNYVYNDNQRKHLANNLWMGAAHGRNLSSIWVWERTGDQTSDVYNSVLTRPDIVAQTGKTTLDLTRLSEEATKIQQEKPKAALLYSKPSRLYDASYSKRLFSAYEALLSIGQRPGIVSDKSIELLSYYEVLIIPGASNGTDSTREAVETFIKNGGKVIYCGNPLSADEYNRSADNSYITGNSYMYTSDSAVSAAEEFETYLTQFGLQKVIIRDDATGKIPDKTDWSYSLEDDGFLLNITNLKYDDVRNISIYLNGEKITDFKELISGTETDGSVRLEGYVPQLLKYRKIDSSGEVDTVSINRSNKAIEWTYDNSDCKEVKIYKAAPNGELEFLETVTGTSFSYNEEGTFVLKTGEESKGEIITVTEQSPFNIVMNNAEYQNQTVKCEVEIKNNFGTFASGIICVKLKDELGNEMNRSYYKPVMRSGQKNSVKFLIYAAQKPASIEAVVWDSCITKYAYSNIATK